MPNLTVTNYNASPISVLGLGPVASGATKTGYVEEAQYAAHARAYKERASKFGVLVQEVGGSLPDNVEAFTTTGAVADTTRLATLVAADPYVLTLPAAADVDAGTSLFLGYSSGDSDVTVAPAGADTTNGDAVTYNAAATAADGVTGFAITGTTTITRNDGGSWLTEGYLAGGRIVIANAEDVGNNGTHVIATVSATVLTTTGLTNNAADTTMTAGVDNRIRLNTGNPSVQLISDGVSNWAVG